MRAISFLRVLLVALVVLLASSVFSQVAISVSFGPPPLPVYEQPVCPGEGYIWAPGYWAWDDDYDDYYWVPGTWVEAPEVGYLWTPPWWGWENGVYLFHAGWWGPEVGFYGGIDYGFGYFGDGYVGGRWEGGRFFYNRSVTNINVVNIRNVYNERVNVRENHVSFNGGPGGISARPRPQDEAAARGRHIGPVAAQTEHLRAARGNPELRASNNHGRPAVAATGRAGEFRGVNVIPARSAGGEYHPPANRGGGRATGRERPPAERAPAGERAPATGRPPAEERSNSGGGRPYTHARDLPPIERPTAPNSGNANRDWKYQQQQEKLYNRQNQERQKLTQQQEREHQRMPNPPPQREQQMEQRHQLQTNQMQQRHEQQQQRMTQRQAPPPERKK